MCQEIHDLMLAHSRRGCNVVRLKCPGLNLQLHSINQGYAVISCRSVLPDASPTTCAFEAVIPSSSGEAVRRAADESDPSSLGATCTRSWSSWQRITCQTESVFCALRDFARGRHHLVILLWLCDSRNFRSPARWCQASPVRWAPQPPARRTRSFRAFGIQGFGRPLQPICSFGLAHGVRGPFWF